MGKNAHKVLNDAKRQMAEMDIFHIEMHNTQSFSKIT